MNRIEVFRFLFRSPTGFGWWYCSGATAPMPPEIAHKLVSDWNKRDRGRFEWKTEKVELGDFDYIKL